MKKYLNLAIVYLVLGLLLGIFYREFTKFNDFEGESILGTAHAHTLILGFIFFLLVMILEKNFELSKVKSMKVWTIVYNVSLVYMLGTIIGRGIMQVLGTDFAGFSHIAGLAHGMLGVSLLWFVIIIRKAIK